MKALSIRQPWAWLIVHARKTIENRRWAPAFRGRFLIHAAKGVTHEEYADAVAFARHLQPSIVVPPLDQLERGGVVAHARLVDVIPPCSNAPGARCIHPWHMPGQYGLVLEDVKPIPFRAISGALGFFEVPS